MALEREFAVSMHVADAEQIESVPDAVDYFTRHPMARGKSAH
jgi:acyl carrier protein